MKRLGKGDFKRLFKKLDDELKYTGARVQLYVFGGAAVALGYSDERVTTDVDAIITTDERSVLMRAVARRGETRCSGHRSRAMKPSKGTRTGGWNPPGILEPPRRGGR